MRKGNEKWKKIDLYTHITDLMEYKGVFYGVFRYSTRELTFPELQKRIEVFDRRFLLPSSVTKVKLHANILNAKKNNHF